MCLEYISRREMLKLASLLTVGGAAPLLSAFNAQAQPKSDGPVKIGYLPITDAAPLLVAHNNGYFKDAGVEVEKPTMLRSWAQLIEAFIAGQVNVVHLLSPMTVWARFGSKVPAKVVAWNHVDGSALTVAKNIHDLKDLAGKTIAVPFWYSIHNVVLQAMLRDAGLTPVSKKQGKPAGNEVNLVVMAPSDMPPALATGKISGYIVAEPFNAVAEVMDIGKVLRFTGDVWKNHACCTVFMHERDLEQRPEWSQKVVDAIVRAQLWIRDHREETAKLLSKEGVNHYTPHALPVLSKVLAPPASDTETYLASRAIRHAQWQEKRIDFQPYPYPSYTEELVARLKDTLIEADRGFLTSLDGKTAASQLVDDRFVKRAIEALGGMSKFGQPAGYSRKEVIELS
ncbi:ABC transporter substrate-binding protein [Orrella sp. NBD-18]|uniref:ABC transporter substrate-binding protein n=1 Tax=Sheuella amnicola TaxID=2707330 RepID=A0A6B2R0V6_9BURK|nr:ABC transporter substrate-binding protein [Sheuella amnicola]NDY82979.1 ABC transporter substrate-binding protein [Sheuella amnicola]HBI82728.1 ABC transporter substrate-binding protein [Alcaligenaceae bacterium]